MNFSNDIVVAIMNMLLVLGSILAVFAIASVLALLIQKLQKKSPATTEGRGVPRNILWNADYTTLYVTSEDGTEIDEYCLSIPADWTTSYYVCTHKSEEFKG